MNLGSQENSDLLHGKRREIIKAENGNSTVENDPPDGGFKAYTVIVGSFLTNGIILGVINSYSVIYTKLQQELKINGVPNAESRASLVGALSVGTTFLLSPVSGVLADLLGLRFTAILGGSIAVAGLLISSFLVNDVNALSFTYGILYGTGAALAYTPSLAILGHYFKKYLGRVNGLACIGSSVFTMFMPTLMDVLIKNHGLEGMFRVLALITSGVILCGLLFKPVSLVVTEKPKDEKLISLLKKEILDVNIWKNKKYRCWVLCMPVALLGYFVPYVHIKEFIKLNYENVNDNLPITCIAVMSGIGRLTFGYLGDRANVDRILLQQISFYVIGTVTMIMPFMPNFTWVVLLSLFMGLFDGAFIALIGPIAFQLCGKKYGAKAIGCMLGLAAFPLSLGPPVAGFIFSATKSYTLPFVLAGLSPLVGASLMFLTRYQDRKPSKKSQNRNGGILEIEKHNNVSTPLTNGTASQQQTAL